MLPALAPLSELEARLGLDAGTLAGAEKVRAQAALDDASTLVRDETRQSWVAPDGATITAPAPLIRVVLGAARRNQTNPDAEIAQTVGPYNRTLKADEVSVYLTDAEIAIVRRYCKESTGLWTQRTTRGERWDSTLYLEDNLGFELFPVGTEDKPWL
jgi:hypothetical protein